MLAGLQPLKHDRNKRDASQRGEGCDQLRRQRRANIEIDFAIQPARRLANMKTFCLRRNHIIKTGAEKRERECRRNNAKRGRGHKRSKPHADNRRREIDQKKWKNRNQPEKQQVAECIFAKTFSQLGKSRPRAPHQKFTKGTACNQEKAGGADRGPGHRRETAEKAAE